MSQITLTEKTWANIASDEWLMAGRPETMWILMFTFETNKKRLRSVVRSYRVAFKNVP